MRRRLIILAFGLCATASAAVLVHRMIGARHETALAQRLGSLVAVPAGATASERFDAARRFVNSVSENKMDGEFQAHWRDHVWLMEAMVARAEGRRATPVHLECSTRRAIMARILTSWGFRSRSLDLYSTSKNFAAHSLLDVWNPETKSWETHDPDYDVDWKRAPNGPHVSLADAGGDPSAIVPCGASGCSHQSVNREGMNVSGVGQSYLEIIAVHDREAGERYAVVTPRADLDKQFEVKGRKGRFCDVLAKACRDGIYPISGPGPHRAADR